MTARVLLLAALCAAGCAARSASVGTNGGGGQAKLRLREPNTPGLTGEQVEAALAPADSYTLTFTAPSFGSLGCEADTSRPLHGGQRVYLLRLRGQVPNYWPGMMQTVAGMDSVRLLTRPDTVWRASVQPGVRSSVRVAAGEYVAETQGQRCARWRVVRVP